MVADTAALSLNARSQQDHPRLLALADHVTRDTPLIQAESSTYIKTKTKFEHRQDSTTENEHARPSDRRCLHCIAMHRQDFGMASAYRRRMRL